MATVGRKKKKRREEKKENGKKEEKKKSKRKAFKAFTASIKAVTLLRGGFIAPLQPQQQLFSRAGLKRRPEPAPCCSSVHGHFPSPCSNSKIHFSL